MIQMLRPAETFITSKLKPTKDKEKVPHSKKVEPKFSKHYVGTVVTSDPKLLVNSLAFIGSLEEILRKEKVQRLGYVRHDFSNNSFTIVVALAESHISIHTWPERHAVQLDVFLCNYMNDNTKKCQRIFDAIVQYFEPVEVETIVLDRL